MKRLLPLCLAFCLLAGCGPVPVAPETTPIPNVSLRPQPAPAAFALPYDPGSGFDPLQTTGAANLTLCALLYEGLFALDAAFSPAPVLCDGFTMAEGAKDWTFSLKSGVTFSDGTPLTAAAVRTALLAAMGKDSLYATRLAQIALITAADDLTLQISLSAPNKNLPALLDVPIFSGGETPVGTGPYVLQGETLTVRESWWQGVAPPLQAIPLVKVSSPEDLIYSFDAGDISLVTADLTSMSVLGYAGNYEVLDYPTSAMLYVGFNAAKGPCKSAELRSALTLGFDRTSICGSLLAGHALPAYLPVHPDAERRFSATATPQGAYSLPELGKRLDALGYVAGEDGLRYLKKSPLTLTMVVNTDNGFKTGVAEFLAETLGREGVVVTLKKLSWEDYTEALKKGDFDLYLGETKLTADFDPSALIRAKGALNFGKFSSLPLEAALLAAKESGDYGAFYSLFLTESPWAPLCFKTNSILTRWGRVQGASPTQSNVFYDFSHWIIQ